MSENECKHLTWLERMIPQFGDLPHWTAHDVEGLEPPHEFVSDNIIFSYCPLCGTNLDSD